MRSCGVFSSVKVPFVVVFVLLLAFSGSALARDAADLVSGYAPLRVVVKPRNTTISPAAPSGHIVVKFRRGTVLTGTKSRLGGSAAEPVRRIFADYGLTEIKPLVDGEAAVIQARRMVAEDRVRTNLPDMSLYIRHAVDDPVLTMQVIAALNARDEVEIAYFEPRPEVASYPNDLLPIEPYAFPAVTTPSFESSQAQLNSAPGGVDAKAAWSLPGGDGAGTRVIDIEYGWQLTHEDLSKGATAIMIGANSGDNDHGTAVLGEMVADRNSFGMTGISPEADIGYSSVASFSFASCMDQAAAASDPGDCILIELHAPGPHFNFEGRDDQSGYVPMEYFQGNFDAILNAYGVGAIVCEAAGNGQEDLDHFRYDDAFGNGLFDTTVRNSHAIMCGAGNPPYVTAPDRSKLGFSNYGERVNLQGYGTNVYTTGYSDLYNGGTKDSWYTQSFSGTSSASPIVTGAVLCLSGVFQQMLGTVIDADSARTLLVATGSPQTQPQIVNHIGPRPDLRAALGLLFDPIDSIWYDNIGMDAGASVGLPISLANSHAVSSITLPFVLSGDAPVQIDSVSFGPRTVDFASISLLWDNRFNGQATYKLTAAATSINGSLVAGTGIVAYLWLTAPYAALLGQSADVDTAWFSPASHLQLASYFDNGYPDYFSGGSVTITGVVCDCSFHGDLNGDGDINVFDIVGVVDIAFREGDPAISDESCPHETRADYNCDGEINVFDVVSAVEIAFREGSLPCDLCGG